MTFKRAIQGELWVFQDVGRFSGVPVFVVNLDAGEIWVGEVEEFPTGVRFFNHSGIYKTVWDSLCLKNYASVKKGICLLVSNCQGQQGLWNWEAP